jgi:hypothetical protein
MLCVFHAVGKRHRASVISDAAPDMTQQRACATSLDFTVHYTQHRRCLYLAYYSIGFAVDSSHQPKLGD